MRGNRPLIIVLVIILLLVLGLGGFYLYLSGGNAPSEPVTSESETGIVHVRSIYTYGDGQTIRRPVGVGADEDGNFFVTLRDDSRVVEFDSDGDYVGTWGERGVMPGNMMAPLGVAVDRLVGHVYVVDRSRLRLICYNASGEYQWEIPVLSPLGVDVDSEGNVVVATFGPLTQLSPEGEVLFEVGTRGLAPGQFDFPRNVVVGDDGRIFVADTNNARIQAVQMSGDLTATVDWNLGDPPRFQDDPDTRFVVPSGIALDRDGRVVVLDGFNHTLEVLDPETGESIYDFGERRGVSDGTFNLPTGITHLGDNYFAVTDTFNDRIQIIRLLTPEQNNIVARNPWMQWLLLAPLAVFLLFLGRKKVFVTREALEKALDEGNARLILAVHKSVYALNDVVDEYADVEEAGVRLGDYLISVSQDEGTDDGGDAAGAPEARITGAARRSVAERVLLRRHKIVCRDASQCDTVRDLGGKPVDYDQLTEDYALDS